MNLREGVNIVVNSKSKTFLTFCFSFLIGVATASLLSLSFKYLFFILVIIFLTLFSLAYFWHHLKIRLLALVIFFFIAGILKFIFFLPEQNNPSCLSYYYGKRITVTAFIGEDPARKISSAEYVLGKITIKNKVSGKMLLRMPLYPELNYGDEVRLSCLISKPENFDNNFQYDKYLAIRGIYATCSFPEIVSTKPAAKPDIYGRILRFKQIVREKVVLLWPEPMSSFMAGLIYGERSGFSPELSEDFRRTGLSHIVAVSGYNVSIVSGFLLSLLIIIGLYRRQALVVALVGIILFVIFVGASASAVRAGIMGSIVLVGQYFGRPSRAIPALIFAAALMVLHNPIILIWDAGFQLSCLATAGIIYAPKPSKRVFELLTTTLAATIATLPLILAQFGRFSTVSLLVNLLVVWLIPWIMLAGFMAVMISFIFSPIATIVAAVANLGLLYVIFVAERFSKLSIASIEISFSPWLMAVSYVIIILLVRHYGKRKNKSI